MNVRRRSIVILCFEARKSVAADARRRSVIWEHPDALLAAGHPRRAHWRVGRPRPPLPPRETRISVLTPSGLHFGQAPLSVFRRDAAPVHAAATALMQALITRPDRR